MTGRNKRIFEGSKRQCLVLFSFSGDWKLDEKWSLRAPLGFRLGFLGYVMTLH